MRKQKKATIGDKEVVVKELTIGEVKNALEEIDKRKEPHVIELLFPDVPAIVLSMSTGLSAEEFEHFTQSEMEQLISVFKEVNPFLSGLLKRLAEAAKRLLEK